MICVVWQDNQGKKVFYPAHPDPRDPKVDPELLDNPRALEKWQVQRAFLASLVVARTCPNVELQDLETFPINAVRVSWEAITLAVFQNLPISA